MAKERHLAFTIAGGNASPSGVRLRDLVFLLSELETAIAATAKQIGTEGDAPLLSLTEIRTGSAVYDLSASEVAGKAASRIATAIKLRNSETLPQQAVHSLKEMHKRATKMDRSLTLNNDSFSSTIHPSIPLFADTLIHGATTVFGYLNTVGGTRPTAKLRLAGDRHLTAEVASQALAQQLAGFLYRYVTLEGDAWWHASTMELRRFKIKKLGEYDDRASSAAPDPFAALAELSPGLWDNIDPDAYIREQRDDSSQ